MSMNSLKHGCCAETLLLKSEKQSDYNSLEALWVKAYSPKDEAERHLLQELIHADWFLQRATRTVAHIETELLDAEPNPIRWTEAQQKTLGRFLRYQTARANNLKRAQKALEDYRKNRASEKPAPAPQKPAEPTWKEHLENMRQRAIALGYATPEKT